MTVLSVYLYYTIPEMARKRSKKSVHTTVTPLNPLKDAKVGGDAFRPLRTKTRRKQIVPPRTRKVIQALAEDPDRTFQQAGEMAGFPKKTAASQAHRALRSKGAQEFFDRAMAKHPILQDDGIAQTLAEGMRSTAMKFFAHEGQVIDERECVDFGARHSYVSLVTKLRGLDPSANGKHDITTNGESLNKVPTAIAALAALTQEQLLALIAATDSGKSAIKSMEANPPIPSVEAPATDEEAQAAIDAEQDGAGGAS